MNTPSLLAQNNLDSREESIIEAYAKRREALEVQKELYLVKLKKLYHDALESLAEEIRLKGDFDNFMKVEAEMTRTEASMSSPEKLSDNPALAKLQNILISQLDDLEMKNAGELVSLHEQLDHALAQLQQKVLQGGNIAGAKQLQTVRDQQRKDPDVEKAYTLNPAGESPLVEMPVGPAGFTLAHAQKRLKGRVTHFNPVTREIEIVYDFESREQLKDFTLRQERHIKVEGGTLTITTPPGSDWSFAYAELKCPYVMIPFFESGDISFQVDLLKLEAVSDYHVAVGMSDLGKKTMGLGPLSITGAFTVEGWTPDNVHQRAKPIKVSLDYPATLSFIYSSKKIKFVVESGKQDDDVEIDTDASLIYPGFYPKSWGAQGTTAVYDNLVIRGILKADFEK